jgi:ATP-dependent DNA helicase RecQ
MFKQGKDIFEIAALRKLSVVTIESHLAYFVENGALDVNKLVPQHKVNVIIDELKSSPGPLTPVKEKLGDDYSFAEIRAVIGYLRWRQQAGLEN